MRVVGLSAVSVSFSSDRALKEFRSVISCSHCWFSVSEALLTFVFGVIFLFCWKLPPSSFPDGVLVRCW
jgi:hypothetical protein